MGLFWSSRSFQIDQHHRLVLSCQPLVPTAADVRPCALTHETFPESLSCARCSGCHRRTGRAGWPGHHCVQPRGMKMEHPRHPNHQHLSFHLQGLPDPVSSRIRMTNEPPPEEFGSGMPLMASQTRSCGHPGIQAQTLAGSTPPPGSACGPALGPASLTVPTHTATPPSQGPQASGLTASSPGGRLSKCAQDWFCFKHCPRKSAVLGNKAG